MDDKYVLHLNRSTKNTSLIKAPCI